MPNRKTPRKHWPAKRPDVRNTPFNERQQLNTENSLAILVGETYVCSLPIELFCAVSTLGKKIDMKHEHGPALALPNIETWPVFEIITWVRQLTENETVTQLDVMRDNNNDLCTFRDLSLVRAGQLLGMDLYVHDMYDVYMDKIIHRRISFEDVDAIVKLSLKRRDTFLMRLGMRLGKMTYRGYATSVFPWINEYLKQHEWLQCWVEAEVKQKEKRTKAQKLKEQKSLATVKEESNTTDAVEDAERFYPAPSAKRAASW